MAAFGKRPTQPERLTASQQAVGAAAIYEDRWMEKLDEETPGEERSPTQERDGQGVQAAKRAWTSQRDGIQRARVNPSIGQSTGP